MHTIRIFGAQDYMVCIEGGIQSEAGTELNALTHPLLREHGYFGILHISVSPDKSGLYVHPIFSGTWSFAVSPDETEELPNWPVRRSWGTINEGSETLEIDVPEAATLKVLPPVESQSKLGT